ncbi:esterase [Pollutimonas nitritireducens]|uniref:Esterase n=1 Tax=Pollutimonas nitritireducens TaxID=2045209 RepID=A0A2N4UJU8_9BURK|nr:esterase [Pollutimonas nitritireducens]PLC55296.1 esterase [Pollutimonas nitritireducens]
MKETFRQLLLTGGVVAVIALTGCATKETALPIKDVGSFHIGGRPVTLTGLPTREITFTPGAAPIRVDPNGDFEVEAMYARYTLLTKPKARYPLLMWHGGGLSGVTWETKPDGNPGWENYFLWAGHDVYVSDAVERGRASWARYPEIFKSEPFFRTKKEAWELFRIGPVGSYRSDPAQRQFLPGTQFPIDAFDQMAKQSIPRWSTNDAATQDAYDAYVKKVCPCVIMAHSQGGNFAFTSALENPDLVKGIVIIEPSGSPDPATADYSRIKGIPMLWVWGDNTEQSAFWQAIVQRQETFRSRLQAAGGKADVLRLPQAGMRGNSHMIMMDKNSDQVAERIQVWMTSAGLMR